MRPSATVVSSLALVLLSAAPAVAAATGDADKGGIETSVSSTVLDRARKGLDLKTGVPDPGTFEYTSTTACQNSIPGSANAEVLCVGATSACAGNTAQQGQGPQVRLYRRELDANRAPITGWQLIGTTCSPELVPGQPVLGMGQILAAFHNTPFAKPAVHIQPEGNATLVTLPTYFAVTWPQAGFQPGETDTITLLGQPVQIRPTLDHYTYDFGDGTTTGPTSSPGGPYPDGDITHTYPSPGTYNTHIDITFGGEFAINAGPWLPIPDTVTIAGPIQPLTVKTARARLVTK